MIFFLREERAGKLGLLPSCFVFFRTGETSSFAFSIPFALLAMSCRSPHRALGLFGGGVDSCGAVFVLGKGGGRRKGA